MNDKQTLQAMRQLLDKPEHWTQGYYAHTHDGNETDALGPDATCWCLLGAYGKVTEQYPTRLQMTDVHHLTKILDLDHVHEFNDRSDVTHADIIKVLDDAIARLD